MDIRYLGPLEAVDAGVPLSLGGPKQRLVLAHLLVHANRTVPVDRLIADVWDGDPPHAARASLQTYVSHLRRALGADRIGSTGHGYALRVEPDEVDAARFEQLLDQARTMRVTDPEAAARTLRDGLAMWRGPAFADLADVQSLQPEITRLEELRAAATEERIAADLDRGRDTTLIGELEALTAVHPLRERLWGQLMVALYRAGRQGEALEAYQRARSRLADELGVDPSPELRSLHERVLRQDPALHGGQPPTTPPATPARVTRNPYKGLSPFGEDDAADFFGRDAMVARLLTALRDRGSGGRFLAVVGPSGSGKSSVVRAGLIPALRGGALSSSQRWRIVTMSPGQQPFDELAAGLRQTLDDAPSGLAQRLALGADLPASVAGHLPGDSELLVVIDQFEELFTQVPPADCERFVDAVVAAVTDGDAPVRVIVTLRADFYDRPLALRALAELLRTRTEIVMPMSPEELEQAIRAPAAAVGVDVEGAVLAAMVADVAEQPGGLPLLQYALTELFDRRDGQVLTLATYREIGGVTGALARRAEAAYQRLPAHGHPAARQVFLRLVTPGEGVEDTRRRATVPEVTALDNAWVPAVLAAFGDARLLSFDRDADTGVSTVEVAHEALLGEWHRLRGWIDAARDDLRTHRRLRTAARDWNAADRDPSFLATGARLDRYEAWRATSGLAPDPLDDDYLDASVEHRDRLQAKEAARQERERALERRSLRRLRVLVGVLAVAALVGGTLTVIAVTQALRAERQARVAAARELAAASVANLDVDAERSILLALEAIDQTRDADGTVLPEAGEALHRAVTSSRIALRVPDLGGSVAWHPDGDIFVTEGPEDSGLIDVRDAASGESVRSWRGHDVDINDVGFSDDGALLVTTGDDGALRAWDPASGDRVAVFASSDPVEVWGPSVSPDGELMAAAWLDEGIVRVVDVSSGEVRREIVIDAPIATAFSPDGAQLGVSTRGDPGNAVVHDLASGDEIFTLDHETDVVDIDWSPDGRWISTSTFLSSAHLFDAATGEPRLTLTGHTAQVNEVDWHQDSTRVATASDDGTVRVWDISDRAASEVLSLSAQDTVDGLIDVAFAPDGERLLVGDRNVGSATIWDIGLSGTQEWANLPSWPDAITPVAFARDSRHVVIAGPDAGASLWDATTGRLVREYDPSGPPAEFVRVSPDGSTIVGANIDGTIRVWDADSGTRRWQVVQETGVNDLAMGGRGDYLLATSDNAGVARLYNEDGREVAALDSGPDRVAFPLAVSGDGRVLAIGTVPAGRPVPDSERVHVWDTAKRQMRQTLKAGLGGLALDDRGRHLVTARQGVGTVWDLTEGREVATLSGHSGDIFANSLSGDGSRVATAGFDGTARLWDANSGAQQLVLRGHRVVVAFADFSPDGSKLVTGGWDGTARVWALDLDDLIAIAEDKLTRGLAEAECREYLHLNTCADND